MQMDTRVDYVAVVRETVAEIQRRLDDPPGFRELADRAFLSPYYFHRIFRAMAGESPAEMVRRLKLERSAWQIRNSADSITEIAFDAGYATHEAFTKAFQSEFGIAPSGFRARPPEAAGIRCPNNLHYVEGGFTVFNLVDHGDVNMKTEVVEMPTNRTACVRHKGPYSEIGSTFSVLGQKGGPMGLFTLPDARGIAIYLDDPETTPAAELNSLAGIIVAAGTEIGDLEEFYVPGGKYFKAEYTGPYTGLSTAWGAVCGKLWPEAGYQIGDGLSFELYLNDYSTTPPEQLRTDIYVPIV
jgi:AraC family transcriptional regulator